MYKYGKKIRKWAPTAGENAGNAFIIGYFSIGSRNSFLDKHF